MSSKASSTIGFERRFNNALQLDDEFAFVAENASVVAPKPPNMTRLVELNRGPFVGAPREVDELPAAPDGVTVLDVRPASDYLAGHVHGALNVPVGATSEPGGNVAPNASRNTPPPTNTFSLSLNPSLASASMFTLNIGIVVVRNAENPKIGG